MGTTACADPKGIQAGPDSLYAVTEFPFDRENSLGEHAAFLIRTLGCP